MTAQLLMVLAMMAGPARVGRVGAVLRTGCDGGSTELSRLAVGTEVEVKFSMNGEAGACYKVEAGGRTGWLGAGDLEGLEGFDRARRAGNQTNSSSSNDHLINKIDRSTASDTRLQGRATETVKKALEILDQHQPKQALRLMEWSLANEGRKDAFGLAVAGVAAYQSDELQRAAEYWRESLALEANPSVERLLGRIRQEAGADTGRNVTNGERFRLRYDEGEVPAHVAAVMLDALDGEYRRIDEAIGCGGNEAITAIVQSREAYKASAAGAEWSAAQYDGRIRVGMPDGAVVTPELRRRFGHEIVHACLARRGRFPAWFHEGLAQRLMGDRLSGAELGEVQAALRDGKLPGLGSMAGAWSGMSAGQARLAYDYALAAVDLIYGVEGEVRVRELIRSPGALGATGERVGERLKQ